MSRARIVRLSQALLLGTALASPALAGPVKSTTAGVVKGEASLTPSYGKIDPFYRNIRAFWGDVNPFYRNIRAFWGDVDPFYRNIRAFWGNLDPMYRNIRAFAAAPEFAGIGPYWDEAGATWTAIDSAWGQASGAGYQDVATQLQGMTSTAESFWGAAVQAKTGKSFADGFANPLFARFGIDLSKPETLAALSPEQRSHFFMDWYDGLMTFSGTDHVDHWMMTANWTPRLTQVQGSGSDAVIGLVDFFVSADTDIKSKVVYSGGVSTYDNGHGAGVGSLMVSSHDGKGVMGIAPAAKVAAFNPFDATGTTDWPDVKRGIVEVTKRNAAVVNLSLGVSGWTFHGDWRGVFKDSVVLNVKDKTLYVIAAGNDGITQTQNVNMKDAFDNTFLVVGAVDPSGNISEFSNRPGNACLTEDTKCENILNGDDYFKKSGYLRNRFIVAPGELILVSDGKGGIVRQSGTSLAAPLVSGAVALIHDRWPWLKAHPRAVATMILKSAKDLGEPGIDGVYGVGLLDVEASQSPLSFAAMKYYLAQGTKTTEVKLPTILSTGGGTVSSTAWETSGAYFSAFEKIASAERDFLIPLSSRLIDAKASSGEYFQDYVYNQLVEWVAEKNGFAGSVRPRMSLTDAGRTTAEFGPEGGWRFSMTGKLRHNFNQARATSGPRLDSTLHGEDPSGRLAFSIGRGAGAVMVGGTAGFGMSGDFDPQLGGANPLLGFASGGSHAAVHAKVAPALSLSMGFSEKQRSRDADVAATRNPLARTIFSELQAYRASAAHVRLDYQLMPAVSVSAAWTRLDEPNALLGVRSFERSDFGGGSVTDGATVGVTMALPEGFSLAVAANRSRTETSSGAMLYTDGSGLIGSSYQVTLAKAGLFGKRDGLRLSLSQPLTIDSGTLAFSSVAVIDRETGEKGIVTQRMQVAGERRLVAEGVYGAPLADGAANLSLFARGELKARASAPSAFEDERPRLVAGLRGTFAF